MELEDIRDDCLRRPGVTEGYPFGEDALVFKVQGKMFCLMALDDYPSWINLKCDPARALELRQEYPGAIKPGYHMNKKHWNTLTLNGLVPDELMLELVDHSYELVVAKLTRAQRAEIGRGS